MNSTFFLHRSAMHPCRALAEIPKGRVALMCEPVVGESLIIVPEGGGIVQTSRVHAVTRTDNGFVVETSNSIYRFSKLQALADVAA